MYFIKKLFNNRRNKIVMIIGLLSICSLITIYGVTPQLVGYGDSIPINFVLKQGIGIVVGFFIIFLFSKFDLWKSEKYIDIINIILIVMLVILALDPPIIGDIFVKEINGAKGWFKIPFLPTIQPIEFFKITMIFKLASIANRANNTHMDDQELIKQFLIFGALPILCVILQPDLGGAILLLAPWLLISIISLQHNKKIQKLVKYTSVIGIVGLVMISFPFFQEILVKFTPLKAYQLGRIESWTDPFNTSGGYQLQQSLILMGSAGIKGYGFANIDILIPEPHTDVIFPEFVGMFGWIAGIVLILLYMSLLYLTLKIAIVATEYRDKLLILGFFSLLLVQIIENIGMMLGITPITGIVLPFMSYGVSALITYFIIFAIICNISQKYKSLD